MCADVLDSLGGVLQHEFQVWIEKLPICCSHPQLRAAPARGADRALPGEAGRGEAQFGAPPNHPPPVIHPPNSSAIHSPKQYGAGLL